jgi:hypothetical protein
MTNDTIRPVGRPPQKHSRTAMTPWRVEPRTVDRVRFFGEATGLPPGEIFAESLSERGLRESVMRLREKRRVSK